MGHRIVAAAVAGFRVRIGAGAAGPGRAVFIADDPMLRLCGFVPTLLYSSAMDIEHPKHVRRKILLGLYTQYREDPLNMLSPEEVMEAAGVSRDELVGNIYYLHDRGLVELMTGYAPPLFAAARITADGVDLVENRFELDRRFPPALDELEVEAAALPHLLERLVWEADFVALDGEARRALQRDLQFIRDELARPAHHWRPHVLTTVLDWIEGWFDEPDEHLPSFGAFKQHIHTLTRPHEPETPAD